MTSRPRFSLLPWAIALAVSFSNVTPPRVWAQAQRAKPADTKAQKEKEAEQQKEFEKKKLALLNDVAAGAWGLKLPENRLLIMSEAAGLLWSHDEKRARTIYWDAVNALNLVTAPSGPTAQNLSKEERMKVVQKYLSTFQLREKLVRQVAQRDGQLAIDILRATRQVTPRQYLKEFPLPDDTQIEQAIATEIAAHDPAQALQLARQSLAKGLTFEVLGLWQKLSQVNPQKGSEFAGEVIAKLRNANLANDFVTSIIAIQMLFVTRTPDADMQARLAAAGYRATKPPKITDDQKREIVDLLTNAALSASASLDVVMHMRQVMPEIEEFFPDRRAAIERKMANPNFALGNGEQNQTGYLMNNVLTSEEMLALARGADNNDERISFYMQAAITAMGEGKADSFRELLNKEISNDDERSKVLDYMDSSEINTAAGLKETDKLQKLVPKIRDKVERSRAMAELALLLKEKGQDEEAAAMLDEAASSIKADLKDDKQTNALLALLCAYAVIDPPKAFALAERTVDKANSQISLLLMLDKIVKTGAVKKNEILLEQPNLMPLDFLVFKYGKGVSALAKADFNRTRSLAERFERSELRLMAQLMILKGLLEPESSGSSTTTLELAPQ